jgi:hypothetical protein
MTDSPSSRNECTDLSSFNAETVPDSTIRNTQLIGYGNKVSIGRL